MLNRAEVGVERRLGRTRVPSPYRRVHVPEQELVLLLEIETASTLVDVTCQNRKGVRTAEDLRVIPTESGRDQVQKDVDGVNGPLQSVTKSLGVDVLQRGEHRFAGHDCVHVAEEPVESEGIAMLFP